MAATGGDEEGLIEDDIEMSSVNPKTSAASTESNLGRVILTIKDILA
jgi:hypothetical protein